MEGKELDLLIQKVAAGDNAAFERLYRETARGVYSFAYSFLSNHQDTEDVLQSAFWQIKQKAHTYRRGTNARAWMLQIVKNLALDELRRRKRRGEVELDERSGVLSPDEGSSALDYMMSTLSSEEREIVVLHVYWGYKHREIAEMLHLPPGTVSWKYSAAIKKLEAFREDV